MTDLVTEVMARALRNAWERIDALRDELAQARRSVADAEESAQSSDAAEVPDWLDEEASDGGDS